MGKPIIGVYKITNTLCPEGKYYIGYSCNIRRRWNNHKRDLKNGKHINIYLQNVYNKYGADCLQYEILHDCETKEEAQRIRNFINANDWFSHSIYYLKIFLYIIITHYYINS